MRVLVYAQNGEIDGDSSALVQALRAASHTVGVRNSDGLTPADREQDADLAVALSVESADVLARVYGERGEEGKPGYAAAKAVVAPGRPVPAGLPADVLAILKEHAPSSKPPKGEKGAAPAAKPPKGE